ncbi:MAG: type II toxin-antitoxin system RelE/ParE family toxin [Dehalococcoidia bacterium]|nr:type II toxin-antitoxin system RelE/ParE family toxin [Dehalococcoidia bacterium]
MYAKIESLASDPYQRGAKKLQSFPGFRVRVGQYRILYKVDDVNRTVSIRAVRHRSEVYQ